MPEPTTIKDRIWKYMEKHDISYREMADLLEIQPHQRLYQWLQNPNENFASLVERKFNEMLEESDELS